MSKLVGVACLAVFGFAAGLAYYFLVIEAQKKSQKKTIDETTKVELEPIKEDNPPNNETIQVDAVDDPVRTESPISLDSYEVPSLPASENILTDSLVIVDKQDIEEDQNDDQHEVIANVQGAITLEEELSAAQSALVQSKLMESSAESSKEEESPEADQGNDDKENSGEMSEEDEVVSVVEASQNKAEDSLAIQDDSDKESTQEVVEEVREVIASTIQLESSLEDPPLEKEPSEESVEDGHSKDLEVDAEEDPPFAPSTNDVIHAEPEQVTPESPKPVQESTHEEIKYSDNFAEQDRKLSEVFIQPENLDKEDDVDVASVRATADSEEEDIAGVKALSESENDENEVVAESNNKEVSNNIAVEKSESEDEAVAGIEALADSEDEDAAISKAESEDNTDVAKNKYLAGSGNNEDVSEDCEAVTKSNNGEVSDNKDTQKPEVDDGAKALEDCEGDGDGARSKAESEDDQDVAGIKALAESEDEVPEETPETNGKSFSSDEKAVVDDDTVAKKGKKRNKRKNKRKANGALVDDENEDATRF